MEKRDKIGEGTDAFVAEELNNHQQPTDVIKVEVIASEPVDMTMHRGRGDQVEEMDTAERNDTKTSELDCQVKKILKEYSEPVKRVTEGRIKAKMAELKIDKAEKWQKKTMIGGGGPGKKDPRKAGEKSNQAGVSAGPEGFTGLQVKGTPPNTPARKKTIHGRTIQRTPTRGTPRPKTSTNEPKMAVEAPDPEGSNTSTVKPTKTFKAEPQNGVQDKVVQCYRCNFCDSIHKDIDVVTFHIEAIHQRSAKGNYVHHYQTIVGLENEPEEMETGEESVEDQDVLIIDNDVIIDDIVNVVKNVPTKLKVMAYYDKKTGEEISATDHFADAMHQQGDTARRAYKNSVARTAEMAKNPNPIREQAEEQSENAKADSGANFEGEVVSGTHPTSPTPMLTRRSRRKSSRSPKPKTVRTKDILEREKRAESNMTAMDAGESKGSEEHEGLLANQLIQIQNTLQKSTVQAKEKIKTPSKTNSSANQATASAPSTR